MANKIAPLPDLNVVKDNNVESINELVSQVNQRLSRIYERLPTQFPLYSRAAVNFSPSADISVSATTYVPIDAANFILNFTTTRNSDLICVVHPGTVVGDGAVNAIVHFDVSVDGDLDGSAAAGIGQLSLPSTQVMDTTTYVKLVSNLTAGAHIFKPLVRTTAGTVKIRGVVATVIASNLSMWALELRS